MDPDRLLVRMAKNGNVAAFRKLALRYRDPVLALAYDFLKNYGSAKDVAQNVILKAFKNIGDFEEKFLFSSWLFRITVNASLDTQKPKIRRRKFVLGKKNIQNELQASNQMVGLDESLSVAIQSLTDKQQSAIILRYFHNKSVREMADILDCTESTVRSYLHQALKKLDRSYRKGK
jgi:RNA polymerase sigma-70 factor (ECF subfamily)